MRFRSTKAEPGRSQEPVDFAAALLAGQAPDGGLYVPSGWPQPPVLPDAEAEFPDVASATLRAYLGDHVADVGLEALCSRTFDFPVPLSQLDEDTFLLELFHGPTAAFKDFGARFMANSMQAVSPQTTRNILVATSGDTGSAVAHAFADVPGIHVVLLYPAGMVSPSQERQLTGVPDNVTSVRVAGVFDDCQALVKWAFSSDQLRRKFGLTSANSINIGRLLPQSTYYMYGARRMLRPVCMVVPSGNLGNLTAGLYAKRLGAPIHSFLAALNRNQSFLEYLDTGKAETRQTLTTPSNAMDVGNPSNLARIVDFFAGHRGRMRSEIMAQSIEDDETLNTMRRVYEEHERFVCPHTAVGIAAWRRHRRQKAQAQPAVILATAHAGKFAELVREATARDPQLPDCIAGAARRHRPPKQIEADRDALVDVLHRR